MSADAEYDRSVFINCPFDDDFRPVLEGLLFCIIDCALVPRLASERMDSGEVRLRKLLELMRSCRYSIHDLTRVRAQAAGDFARLNMPFELGVDFGLAQAGPERLSQKRLLVLGERRYDYQIALSDIAGWDIKSHQLHYRTAMRQVRSWLASLGLTDKSPSVVVGDYVDFQEWDYERLLADGWTEADIQERPTAELMRAMDVWVSAGRPITY